MKERLVGQQPRECPVSSSYQQRVAGAYASHKDSE